MIKLAKMPNGEPEIFYTLQGEGVSSGQPATFVRLTTCNLHCSWCDTPYTWNWEGTRWQTVSGHKFKREEVTIEMSPSQIYDWICRYPCKRLIITGGEPLLQQSALTTLLDLLPPEWTVEVETNGTIVPDLLPSVEQLQFNVSLKLPHSGNAPSIALKPDRIRWFVAHPQSYFKFVVAGEEDVAVIRELQADYGIPADRIILMPEGTSSAKLHATLPVVAELCILYGFRLSDRLHVHIWGDERAK